MKGDDDFANTHIILGIPSFLMRNGTLYYGHMQNPVHSLLANNNQYRVYYFGSSLPLIKINTSVY